MPKPPLPADSTQQSIPDRPVDATSPRAILLQHEKDFRESLASLSARVNELQAEVEQLHSSDIFSVKIYKETIEIERLAKHVKSLAKG